jgi:hypothetical protein
MCIYIPPGRDEYFLVNLGSMSAQESSHRACLHQKNVALRPSDKSFFSSVVKSTHPGREDIYIYIYIYILQLFVRVQA